MSNIKTPAEIATFLRTVKTVVVVQADNPDGDSLSSAIAMGKILESLGI
jgi:nanoRNase/pAp phosphatase (c-di-AMP/oligoRNAs hydrolase)